MERSAGAHVAETDTDGLRTSSPGPPPDDTTEVPQPAGRGALRVRDVRPPWGCVHPLGRTPRGQGRMRIRAPQSVLAAAGDELCTISGEQLRHEPTQRSRMLMDTLERGSTGRGRAGYVLSGTAPAEDVQLVQPHSPVPHAVRCNRGDQRLHHGLVPVQEPDLHVETAAVEEQSNVSLLRAREACVLDQERELNTGFRPERLGQTLLMPHASILRGHQHRWKTPTRPAFPVTAPGQSPEPPHGKAVDDSRHNKSREDRRGVRPVGKRLPEEPERDVASDQERCDGGERRTG